MSIFIIMLQLLIFPWILTSIFDNVWRYGKWNLVIYLIFLVCLNLRNIRLPQLTIWFILNYHTIQIRPLSMIHIDLKYQLFLPDFFEHFFESISGHDAASNLKHFYYWNNQMHAEILLHRSLTFIPHGISLFNPGI